MTFKNVVKNYFWDILYRHKGEIMIHLHTMTKDEYEEFMKHNVLHDMAELVLKYGYDEVMSDLANILNNKLDKLEPC